MSPQIKAAIIKAASDWAVFLTNERKHNIGTKLSINTLAKYFDEAYSSILEQLQNRDAV